MNVTQLIAKLKKMPPKAKVYKTDHDQEEHEVNGEVGSVDLMVKGEFYVPELNKHEQGFYDEMPNQWVVLRW